MYVPIISTDSEKQIIYFDKIRGHSMIRVSAVYIKCLLPKKKFNIDFVKQIKK